MKITVPASANQARRELAATAAYLASDDSGFVTASSFPVNGGIVGAFTVPA